MSKVKHRLSRLLGRTNGSKKNQKPQPELHTLPERKSCSVTAPRDLPAELQHQIYAYALSNLEIKIALENGQLIGPRFAFNDSGGHWLTYKLSETSMSHLRFFQNVLFPLATIWKDIPWEAYVTFVFPSALSLLDVFASPEWPVMRLSLVQRVRVFEHQFIIHQPRRTHCYDVLDVLSLLVYFGLSLDTLQYAPIMPLGQLTSGIVYTTLSRVVGSANWKRLELLSTPPQFYGKDFANLRWLISYRQKRRPRAQAPRLVRLRGILEIWNEDGDDIVDAAVPAEPPGYKHPFEANMSVPDAIGVEDWLLGKGLDVWIALERYQSAVDVNTNPDWSPQTLGGLAKNYNVWRELRRSGVINDSAIFRDEDVLRASQI